MNKRIPIRAAKDLAKEFKLDQVIIVAYERDYSGTFPKQQTHVVTYGKSKIDCLQAAQGGNVVKKALGWPDKLTHSAPARMKDKMIVNREEVNTVLAWARSRNGSPEQDEQCLTEIAKIIERMQKEGITIR